MIPTRLVEDAMRNALAADAATLAPAALANHVHLVAAAFVPARDTDVGDLTLATFVGSAAKNAGVGVQQSFYDPDAGVNVVQLLEPAGGWHWQATADPAAAETIFGYVVTDNTDTDTLGSDLLPVPVIITEIGDAVDLPQVRVNIPVPLPQSEEDPE